METRGLLLQARLPGPQIARNHNNNHNGASYGAFLRSKRAIYTSLTLPSARHQLTSRAFGINPNGGRREFLVRCNESDEVDMPVQAPAYTSYVDPNTGEPSPTHGARTPLPNPAWWGEDMQRVVRSGQASTPSPDALRSSRKRSDYVSKRKTASVALRNAERGHVPNEFEEEEEEDEEEEDEEEFVPLTKEQIAAGQVVVPAEGEKLWYTKNDPEHDPIKEAMSQMAEEGDSEEDEEEKKDEGEKGDGAGIVSKEDGALVPTSETEQLTNRELWWNWQKPAKDEEPWSAWHKRSGDSDSVSWMSDLGFWRDGNLFLGFVALGIVIV